MPIGPNSPVRRGGGPDERKHRRAISGYFYKDNAFQEFVTTEVQAFFADSVSTQKQQPLKNTHTQRATLVHRT